MTAPDASLAQLWDDGCGPSRLKSDHYDVVVLQEHSYFWIPERAEQSREADGRWILGARTSGARPVFFQIWTDPGDPNPSEGLEAAQSNARQYGVDIARVGDAFTQASGQASLPRLFRPDDRQPSQTGTWLAALVIFHQLSGEPTERVTWRPAEVSADQAATLEKIADQFG